jgi:hypothetical protein
LDRNPHHLIFPFYSSLGMALDSKALQEFHVNTLTNYCQINQIKPIYLIEGVKDYLKAQSSNFSNIFTVPTNYIILKGI